MVDEFGGMMTQINDKKAGIHSLLVRSVVLLCSVSPGIPAALLVRGVARLGCPQRGLRSDGYSVTRSARRRGQ
jgi:hypothetical protein